ncbi:hypothetical protein PR048_022684 [Dryococelus australis]|uniref:Uncharacterized protein n=1 Tax=Dryococelus australis TaxID=614101 RepID=A0ABQ9GRW2_9NEOP|nr:hypothetical protein PR048_022684 [Dryococelus australis]
MGRNKQQLIKLISQEMVMRSCKIFQAEGDADMDITKAAVNSALDNSTTLIGEDTDLSVLLLHYAERHPKMSCAYSYYFFTHSRDVIPHSVFMVLVKKTVFQKLLNGDRFLHSCASAFTLSGKNPLI